MSINIQKLQGVVPTSVLTLLQGFFINANLNTRLRAAHFLAQCMHESGNFSILSENLNYSADGLRKTFGKYFADDATANAYAHQPEKIASRVYANRMGNGDEASKEGYKFRGRGYIQLTGKQNYTAFGESLKEDIVNTPDIVATPKYGLLSAGWFWTKNGLSYFADKGDTLDVVTQITKRVNGGTLGLDDRWKNFQLVYPLIVDAIDVPVIQPITPEPLIQSPEK